MMYRRGLSLLFLILFISGCGAIFNYDTMVCQQEGNTLHYEISYKDDSVKYITVVSIFDYSVFDESYISSKYEYYEEICDTNNEVEGVSCSIQLDGSILTMKVRVDYKDYDFTLDELSIFPSELDEGDFESVESVRNVFINEDYSCDEIVTN